MAALKKKTDMAIWAIVGSNIFNILWILGFSATFAQLDGYAGIEVDLIVMIFAVVLLLIFAFTPKKNILWRWDGAVLVWVYVAYIAYLLNTL
jgi:cation:H+ antiporter